MIENQNAGVTQKKKKYGRLKDFICFSVAAFISFSQVSPIWAAEGTRVFDEAVELDGLVLTKLDGTAKGGFVFSLASELALPVIFVGVGEKIEDLEHFDAKSFVEAIL